MDFYLLREQDIHSRNLFVCTYLEEVYLKGHHTWVYCQDKQETQNIDDMLWTFKESSFIPHAISSNNNWIIEVGESRNFNEANDILLNLHQEIPVFAEQFRQIIEIVSAEPTSKIISRTHYRSYAAKKYELFTHQQDLYGKGMTTV